MDFRTATSRKLDEEHRESLALLGRFERGVLDVAVGSAPDEGFALLAKQVARAVAGEVDRHFRFEEEQLFPRLAAGGEGDLANLLLDEHKSIRATAADLLPPLLAASTGRLDAAQFAVLKPVALEFVERLEAHIHKETSALLPAVDLVLDDEADQEIALTYAES
jgi:hemerythrin-like domain-containing protein